VSGTIEIHQAHLMQNVWIQTVKKILLVSNLDSFSFIPHHQTKQHTFIVNNKIQLFGYQELRSWSHICFPSHKIITQCNCSLSDRHLGVS